MFTFIGYGVVTAGSLYLLVKLFRLVKEIGILPTLLSPIYILSILFKKR